MKKRIDLNCDCGESFGAYVLEQDETVMNWVSSINIACGYHAGDPQVMRRTVALAVEKGVAIGAHPGFPDLLGFGRREMKLSADEVFNLVVYQVGALQAFAKIYGARVRHVKPHGALYNMAATQPEYAIAIAKAVKAVDEGLILYGLAGSQLIHTGMVEGLRVAQEVFADRTYQPDGTLTPRTQPNAVIHDVDRAVTQVLTMVEQGYVVAVDGSEVALQADTVCIHGDTTGAVEFARQLREELGRRGVEVVPPIA